MYFSAKKQEECAAAGGICPSGTKKPRRLFSPRSFIRFSVMFTGT